MCLFHTLTGLNCPGCGGTRAAYQLLHGRLLLALRDNALFILALAALTARGVWFAVRKIRHQPATLAVPPKGVVGVSGHRDRFQRVAESAGVFISLALNARELFAFAAARSRVQSLTYESDTSIDNHDV